ncbi:MAG: hypothetical protein R3304_09395, partial [Longimicrobiales bacterium]|nr:hypothetical protein [Longimicrobiales bacterium]
VRRDYQFAAVESLARLAGRSLGLRGEVEYLEAGRLSRLRGTVGYEVVTGTRVHMGASWDRLMGGRFTMSVSAYLSRLRSVTQLHTGGRSPAQLTQFNQGTVHWNEATGQLSLAPGPGVERGGISGYVFVDRNGNGRRDAGEEGLEGVRVVVGSQAVETDAQGRHTSWDLVPFEPVRIWVDEASIRDPTLVPVGPGLEVTVPPSSFGRVDIPVTPSREIGGRVVLVEEGIERPLPYVDLELVDQDSGEIRAFRGFSDGEFYRSGIPPGRYRLRLAPGASDQGGLVVEGGGLEVEVPTRAGFDVLGPYVLRILRDGSGS